jgi:hypothetical protein
MLTGEGLLSEPARRERVYTEGAKNVIQSTIRRLDLPLSAVNKVSIGPLHVRPFPGGP